MSSSSWTLAFSSIFTLGALAAIAVAFATDYWIVTTVDRDDTRTDASAAGVAVADVGTLLNEPYSFTRNRGLFRTCYEGNETFFLDSLPSDDVDGSCAEEKGYELTRRTETKDFGSDYDTRIHLMRSHFSFFVLSMFFFLIGIIVGIASCCDFKINLIQIAGIIVFVAAFFAASGMAMFHGYDYLEREKLDINDQDFPAFWDESTDAGVMALADNSKREYGWSYILGWIGVGLGTVGAMLYLCASFMVPSPQDERKEKDTAYAYGNEGFDTYNPYNPYPAGYGAQSYYGYGY